MAIRIKQAALPCTLRRKRSTQAAPTVAPDAATRSAIAPPLVPLLDLLADLIARDLVRERSGDEGLEREVSEAHTVIAAQDDSTVVGEYGKGCSVSHFPSKIPSRVPPKSHSHSPVNDLVRTEEKCHACDRSGDS